MKYQIRDMVTTVLVALMLLAACSSPGTPTGDSPAAAVSTSSVASAPVDLTGEWKQTNSNSNDAWQAAKIAGDEIEVDWVSDGGATVALYWAGTVTVPKDGVWGFSWISNKDHLKTDGALLASSDDTKEFTYKDDVISYSASLMGVTTTVQLRRA